MKDELRFMYLVPRHLYLNLKKFLTQSQKSDLEKANMEQQPNNVPSDSIMSESTIDIANTIEPASTIEPATPAPVQPPEEKEEFSTPLSQPKKRSNGWMVCPVCSKKCHGKKKYDEHMLTHASTPIPPTEATPVKMAPTRYIKFQ